MVVIDELDLADPLGHLLAVQPGHQDAQREPVRFGQGFAVELVHQQHARLRDPLHLDAGGVVVLRLELARSGFRPDPDLDRQTAAASIPPHTTLPINGPPTGFPMHSRVRIDSTLG